MPPPPLTRSHRTRLMAIWRSAGWPCQDGLEIDLLAAGLLERQTSAAGHTLLRVTDAGIAWLAEARRAGQRRISLHDRMALAFARQQLLPAGRIVWRELSLRAALAPDEELASGGAVAAPALQPAAAGTETTRAETTRAEAEAGTEAEAEAEAEAETAPAPLAPSAADLPSLWNEEELPAPPARRAARIWRVARPDLFSIRNTSVPAYLRPMVHEVKASRADLLSDLRHAAKRRAYQWLCEECHYVLPAGIAQPQELPPEFGVWLMHGTPDEDGQGARFELARPARHVRCTLPFDVWMALCRATPLAPGGEPAQTRLGALGQGLPEPDSERPDAGG